MSDVATDDRLMERVANGDQAACRHIVDRHLGSIYAVARRMLGSDADAEDVAQEVFMRVWTKASTWQPGRAQLTTWLHTIAINLCRDRLRRQRTISIDQVAEPEDPAPTAADGVLRREVTEVVESAIGSLPERQREALVLSHYQGLNNIRTAEVLGITVEAVESLLSRARRSLRKQLAGRSGELLGGVR